MVQYKLTYFNMAGRAEPVRWMFAYANQQYEDVRIDRETEWPSKKLELPYGKVPMLEVDGQFLYSSSVICRYLAKKFDLMPEDAYIQAVCDEVVDALNDILLPARDIMFAKMAGKTEECAKLGEDYAKNILPAVGKRFESRLGNNEWFGGNKISWADIYVGFFLSVLSPLIPTINESFPKLKAFVEKIVALPAIDKWIKERPKTAM